MKYLSLFLLVGCGGASQPSPEYSYVTEAKGACSPFLNWSAASVDASKDFAKRLFVCTTPVACPSAGGALDYGSCIQIPK